MSPSPSHDHGGHGHHDDHAQGDCQGHGHAHGVVDPSTALRLGIAFMLARRRVTRRFTYGLGRVEDFAGLVIIATVLVSAFIACYEAIHRLIHPSPNPGTPA